MKRREFVKNTVLASTAIGLQSFIWNEKKTMDVTFFVGADTHFDPPPDSDTYFHVRAMNRIPGTAVWPDKIDGKPTNFEEHGSTLKKPSGVILAGDLLDKADPNALGLFRQRYETGTGDKQINYPVYLGYGNHDLDPNVEEKEKVRRRQMMWDYMEERHRGKNAPVPVTNFDAASRNYSWDWEDLHLVQTHLFAGATSDNQTSSLDWLEKDLQKNASDGRPVVIVQHYGYDKWAQNWWTDKERKDLFAILKKYNVVAIFAGHNHIAENLIWEGIPVIQVNNAWPETGKGNNDGNGSFAVVRITNSFINVVTCRWKNDSGEVELIAPYYSGELN
jgi:cytolysin (calcineurin-like family phosphatase)